MKKIYFIFLNFYILLNLTNTKAFSLNQETQTNKNILNKATEIKKGFYSGTFDPPTKAHNAIIRSAIKNLKLDKLYIFVNKNGEKDYKCSANERVEMLKLMLADLKDKVVIIAQCSDNKRSDYFMIKNILNEKIINITGEDSYKKRLLITPKDRMHFDSIAIVPREIGTQSLQKTELEPIAFYLSIKTDQRTKDISSTKVRQQLENKFYNNIGLTDEVLQYIINNHLYDITHNIEERKQRYLEKYFSYVGKLYAPYPAPPFDPLASEESWQEKFYKWLFIEHKKGTPLC